MVLAAKFARAVNFECAKEERKVHLDYTSNLQALH